MSTNNVTALLELVREPEPRDRGFTDRVMTEVRTHGQRRPIVTMLRRPLLGGIVAAVVATGGAVAALVGTRPVEQPLAVEPERSATVAVESSAAPEPSVQVSAVPTPASSAPSAAPAAVDEDTDHTASTTDKESGLQLSVDTHTTALRANAPQSVRLALTNTGKNAMAVSAQGDCLLELWAYPMGGYRPDPETDFSDPSSSREMADRYHFTRICSAADDDDDAEPVVLEPGATHAADVTIELAPGRWGVMALCDCSWVQAGATPKPPSFLDQLERALPSPLHIDINVGDGGLATPAVRVRADAQ